MTAERLTSMNWTVTILNLGGFSPSRPSHLCSFCSCWLSTPHHWSSCYTAQWCCPPNVRNITGLIKTHGITINYFSTIRITCVLFHFTVFFFLIIILTSISSFDLCGHDGKEEWLWMSLTLLKDLFPKGELVTREFESLVSSATNCWVVYYINIILAKTALREGKGVKWKIEGGPRWEDWGERGTEREREG